MQKQPEWEPAARAGIPARPATGAEVRLLVVDDYETGSHLEIPYVPDEEDPEPVGAGVRSART